MIFLSLIVVLVLVQWWGSGAPLQYDKWFLRWLDFLPARGLIRTLPALHLALAIVVPAAILGLVMWGIAARLSATWLFFINVPVLLYSLGRGNFSAEVKHYIAASERGDNVLASKLIDDLRGNAEPQSPDDNQVGDWRELHIQALQVISYRGFERMFAVLFWFSIFGAVGALIYRLSVIYRERAASATDNRLAARWLWLIEWPAVRLMGLTWALVGNFDTCFRCWQSRLLDTHQSSMALLNSSLRGALGVDDPMVKNDCGTPDADAAVLMPNEPAYSLSLVRASLPLFSRALLFWVCAIAVVTILT